MNWISFICGFGAGAVFIVAAALIKIARESGMEGD